MRSLSKQSHGARATVAGPQLTVNNLHMHLGNDSLAQAVAHKMGRRKESLDAGCQLETG
jgi:hypothetical protein